MRDVLEKSVYINHDKQKEWVKKIAERVLSLPPLPTLVAKLIELIDNPRTNAPTLGKLISTDQVLTSRILKLANSAFYGFPRRISTINLALVVLGFDTIKDLCISVSMRNWFTRDQDDTAFDMSRFWEHSITCGVAGRMIARQFNYRISGEVFVGGLIHDIGKLVLKQYLKPEFKQIMDEVKKTDCLFIEAEEEILGITHATIGSWLAERWNLPKQLVEAIAYHHQPEMSRDHFPLTAIVHFANYLTRMAKIGNSGDHALSFLNERVAEFLKLRHTEDNGIDTSYYNRLLVSELDKAETFLNIIQG